MIHRFRPTPALAFAAGNFTVMTTVAVSVDFLVEGPGNALFSFNSLFSTEVALGLLSLIAIILAVPFHLWFSLRANDGLFQAGIHGYRVAFVLGLLCPFALGLLMLGVFLVFGKRTWIPYVVVGIFPPMVCAELSVFYFRSALTRVLVRR